MKVIFLDFDGVLNNDSTAYIFGFNNPRRSHYEEACPDRTCVKLLDILVQKSDAKIVICSSWRTDKEVWQLSGILSDEFGSYSWESVIGKTRNYGDQGDSRGHQVQDWLESHPDVTEYVIIDDSDDYLDDQRDCFVKVNPEFGFQLADLQKSYDILKVERK